MSFACLVLADESPEFPAALAFAAQLAKSFGWRLTIATIIEPADPAPWVTVSAEMRRQAQAEAEALLERFAAEAWAQCAVKAEPVIRVGEAKVELRKLIEEDHSIRFLVLGASSGPGGPGPLVSSASKGQMFGARPLPVLIVPGQLTKEQIHAMATPPALG
jgi:nucleotide-binding universal stress UspA family protein